MKTIAELIKEAREQAGMEQVDVVDAAKAAGLPVSLRVLSKIENGGACRMKTVESVYKCLPNQFRGDWAAWVQAALAGSARRFGAEIRVGRSAPGQRAVVGLIDTLPKKTRDGIAELIKDPAGLSLLEGTIKAFTDLKKRIR